jgi:hypothetical protein
MNSISDRTFGFLTLIVVILLAAGYFGGYLATRDDMIAAVISALILLGFGFYLRSGENVRIILHLASLTILAAVEIFKALHGQWTTLDTVVVIVLVFSLPSVLASLARR